MSANGYTKDAVRKNPYGDSPAEAALRQILKQADRSTFDLDTVEALRDVALDDFDVFAALVLDFCNDRCKFATKGE